jgi:hypothetical protein
MADHTRTCALSPDNSLVGEHGLIPGGAGRVLVGTSGQGSDHLTDFRPGISKWQVIF